MWFFASLTLLSAAAVAGIIWSQIVALRQGRVNPPPASPSVAEQLDWQIDRFCSSVLAFLKFLAHQFSFYLLVLLQRLLIVLRLFLLWLEKKFSRWIELIRGRGTLGQKGSVSYFLLALGKRRREEKEGPPA